MGADLRVGDVAVGVQPWRCGGSCTSPSLTRSSSTADSPRRRAPRGTTVSTPPTARSSARSGRPSGSPGARRPSRPCPCGAAGGRARPPAPARPARTRPSTPSQSRPNDRAASGSAHRVAGARAPRARARGAARAGRRARQLQRARPGRDRDAEAGQRAQPRRATPGWRAAARPRRSPARPGSRRPGPVLHRTQVDAWRRAPATPRRRSASSTRCLRRRRGGRPRTPARAGTKKSAEQQHAPAITWSRWKPVRRSRASVGAAVDVNVASLQPQQRDATKAAR